MLREGKGNLRLVIPGIPGNPGNHIKSKVKFKILFIFMPWPAIRKTANNDSISRPNSRPKLPFPGNGKRNYKMPREGKFEACITRKSRETRIPAHPCFQHIALFDQDAVLFLGWIKTSLLYFSNGMANFINMTFCMECQKFSLIWIIQLFSSFHGTQSKTILLDLCSANHGIWKTADNLISQHNIADLCASYDTKKSRHFPPPIGK